MLPPLPPPVGPVSCDETFCLIRPKLYPKPYSPEPYPDDPCPTEGALSIEIPATKKCGDKMLDHYIKIRTCEMFPVVYPASYTRYVSHTSSCPGTLAPWSQTQAKKKKERASMEENEIK